MQTNDDEATSIMYDQFLHLVHTSFNIDNDQDAPSHVSESQSQSLENFTTQMKEDTSNNCEESMALKSENQYVLNSKNQNINQQVQEAIEVSNN